MRLICYDKRNSEKGGEDVTLEDEVTLSQRNAAARERLIEQNMDFIRRCASRAAGRFVDSRDDACSEAMIAFNDAITAYRPDRGAHSIRSPRLLSTTG